MNYDPQKAFPYPVLRPNSDDYRDVDFQTTVELSVGRERINARIGYVISSDEIARVITEGKASYISVLSCRDTYFRTVLASADSQCEQEFDMGDLRGEVRVAPYVVARRRIDSFTSPDINPEFGNGPFKFEAGDILAQDEPQVFYVDREMFKPVTSVFELIKKDDLTDGEWRMDFDEDHIRIAVSPAMKEVIDSARNRTSNKIILLNSIYFSAVMQAVVKLKESHGDFEGLKWAEVIERQAHNSGCNIVGGDAYEIAQTLMQFPLVRMKSIFLEGVEPK